MSKPKTREDLRHIVAGGPGEQHLETLFTQQDQERAEAHAANIAAEAEAAGLAQYIGDEAAAAFAYVRASEYRARARIARELNLPGLQADAAIGQKVRSGGRLGAKQAQSSTMAAHSQRDAKIAFQASKEREKNPGVSTHQLAQIIAPKVNLSTSRVRAILARRLV